MRGRGGLKLGLVLIIVFFVFFLLEREIFSDRGLGRGSLLLFQGKKRFIV